MESFGSELKHKLKAVIKAKLMETGHYVDDQLPTYIMVMVTNRRSKKEMDKELSLFLGDETDSFTTWLLSVFKKLDVAVVPAEASSSGIKRKSSSTSSDTEKKKIKKKLKKDMDESSSLLEDEYNKKIETQSPASARSVGSSPPLVQKQTSGLLSGAERNEIEAEADSSDDSEGPKIDSHLKEDPKEDSEEEEDFLNIKEEDIEDFLNETEEAVEKKRFETVVGRKGASVGKSSSARPKEVASEKSAANSAKKLAHKSIIDQKQNKNDNVQSQLQKPPKLSRQALRTAQKSVMETLGGASSSSALLDEKKTDGGNKRGEKKTVRGSAIVEHQPSSSVLVRSKKSVAENVFKGKNDDYVDAREFINRKRGLVSSQERQQQSPPPTLDKKRKNAEEGPALGRGSDKESDSGRFYQLKHKEGKSSATTVRGRKERSSSVEFISSSEGNASRRGIRRTVMNDRYNYRETAPTTTVDSATGNNRTNDQHQQVKRKRGDKQSEIAVDKSRGVKRKLARGKLQEDESSGSGNLVRKAFAEVQRSLTRPKQRLPEKKQHVDSDTNTKRSVRKPEMQQKDASPKVIKKSVQQGKKISHRTAEKTRYEREDSYVEEINFSPDEDEDQESTGASESSSKTLYYQKEQPQQQQQFAIGTAQQIKVESSAKDEEPSTTTQKVTLSGTAAKLIRTAVPVATTEVEEYDPMENSPQFVVTLNGVDPGKFTQLASQMEVEEDEDEVVSTVSAMPNDVDMNVDRDADLRTPATMAIVPKKKAERCKFWPACLTGENCLYVHPSSACKMFPNCKFGNSCLFIHPKCKFDSGCTRFDCQFSHTDEVLHAAMTSSAKAKVFTSFKPPCKYFPNCTNIACPFQHPKLCRYDKYCLNKKCAFTHTGTPSYTKSNMSGDKLKWTNPHLYSLNNVSSAAAATSVNTQSTTTTAGAAHPPTAVASANLPEK